MAGNIMAIIPTTQTRRKDRTTGRLGEANMLAIDAIGRGDMEGPIAMAAEPSVETTEKYQATAVTASRGSPTESLKPNSDRPEAVAAKAR
jgi:hypothetical protein